MDRPLFQAAEILNMAIEIEQKGLAFYEGCAARRASSEVAEVFDFAAEQEREHIQVFSRMKRDLDQYSLPESYPGEALAYVRAFVADEVFGTVDEATCGAQETADELAAVDTAIDLERESILFYLSVARLVRESEQDAIDRIIDEEHEHIRRLLALRHDLEQGRHGSGSGGT